MSNIQEYLKTMKQEVENYIEKLFQLKKIVPDELFEAMKYGVVSGGKRVRAILAITISRILGGEDENIFPMASAIEFIHAYSLVHDDLPAIDNDDYRRGQLSTHKKFGEPMGILTGDALLTHAFWIIASQTKDKSLVTDFIEKLAWYAGVGGMVAGQTADVMAEKGKRQVSQIIAGINEKELLNFIHKNKTAALIEVSCLSGAIASKQSQNIIEKISTYGQSIGLAFQVMDDILDVTSTQEKMGKAVNKDASHGKLTYPAIFGLEESQKKANELIFEAQNAISDIDKNGMLMQIAKFIIDREN